MRVVAVQFKARETFAAGVEALGSLLQPVERADLVVCPEMALTGYGFDGRSAVERVAEEADGRTVQAVRGIARRLGSFVVIGFPEREDADLYNSAAIVDPGGELHAVYRKRLLFEADESWARAGERPYPWVETGRGSFSVGICMDLNDDGFLQQCARRKPDVIAFPTNWIQEDGSVQDYWRWRLHTGWPEALDVTGGLPNRAPVDSVLVGANSYGREGRWALRGESSILWRGGVLAVAPPDGDGVLVADVPAR